MTTQPLEAPTATIAQRLAMVLEAMQREVAGYDPSVMGDPYEQWAQRLLAGLQRDHPVLVVSVLDANWTHTWVTELTDRFERNTEADATLTGCCSHYDEARWPGQAPEVTLERNLTFAQHELVERVRWLLRESTGAFPGE